MILEQVVNLSLHPPPALRRARHLAAIGAKFMVPASSVLSMDIVGVLHQEYPKMQITQCLHRSLNSSS